jgi:hypothetical protein
VSVLLLFFLVVCLVPILSSSIHLTLPSRKDSSLLQLRSVVYTDRFYSILRAFSLSSIVFSCFSFLSSPNSRHRTDSLLELGCLRSPFFYLTPMRLWRVGSASLFPCRLLGSYPFIIYLLDVSRFLLRFHLFLN